MTREEAKHLLDYTSLELYKSEIREYDEIIDKVYDDFEGREKELLDRIETIRIRTMGRIALTDDFDKKKSYKVVNSVFKEFVSTDTKSH